MRTFSAFFLLAALALPLRAQQHTGTLGAGSSHRDADIPYDAYKVELAEGQKVNVHLESAAFDTYLIVVGPGDARYENDDFGSTSASEIAFVAPRAGTYTVWASTYDNTGAGDYSLTITPGGVARVETVEGRLDPNDTPLPKGEYADTLERAIEAGAPFDVELRSYGFDGYLVLRAPSGTWYRNDDDGDDTSRSRLADIAPEAGTWTIIVTSVSPDEFGAYDLRILTYPR